MKRGWLASAAGLAVASITLANSVFIVDQRQQAIVMGPGGPARVINPAGDNDPGLKAKLPFIQSVVRLDRRDQVVETAARPIVSADGRGLRVDAVVRYRITDPLVFWRKLGDETTAPARLEPLIDASLSGALGRASAADIVSEHREAVAETALETLRARASGLGLEVSGLSIRRVLPSPEETEAIYQRMTADEQRKASQIRAQGEESRRDITTGADSRANVILAKANEEASAIRGAGDAQAAQLYGAAYGQDPRFAAFYRSMRAYQTALARKDLTLVLPPDSDFFKYFRRGPNAR